MKQVTDVGKKVSTMKVTPEVRRGVFYALVGMAVCFLCFFGIPWVLEECWNLFFHALFGLSEMHFWNALASEFWLDLVLGAVILLKE